MRDFSPGRVDAVFNAADEFMVAMHAVVMPAFVAARAAARHMLKQRSGVIMFVTGSPAQPHGPGTTAIGAAFAALEISRAP